jgi:hypothetical protein
MTAGPPFTGTPYAMKGLANIYRVRRYGHWRMQCTTESVMAPPELETVRSGTYRARHDPDSNTEQSVACTVILAVATVLDRDALDLDPLYDVIDPDALNALVRRPGDTPGPDSVSVRFAFNGCRVTVESTGEIEILVHEEFDP